MKCYACGLERPSNEFGKLQASGELTVALIGSMPRNHIGTVEVFVCPNCGALHTTMRGAIFADDRKS